MALAIQRHFRGFLRRRMLRNLNQSAVIITRAYRGHLARKRCENFRELINSLCSTVPLSSPMQTIHEMRPLSRNGLPDVHDNSSQSLGLSRQTTEESNHSLLDVLENSAQSFVWSRQSSEESNRSRSSRQSSEESLRSFSQLPTNVFDQLRLGGLISAPVVTSDDSLPQGRYNDDEPDRNSERMTFASTISEFFMQENYEYISMEPSADWDRPNC